MGFTLKNLAMLDDYSVEKGILKYIHIESEAKKDYKNKIDNISENVSFN